VGTFKADAAQTPSWDRGAYLFEGLGHCSDCHSPRNVMGAIEKDKAFTGSTIDGWFALNLSSNLHTGLGQWTVDEIATYLKTGSYKGKTTALGPMAEVVQNGTSHLTDADLQAMAEYLKSIPASSTLRTPRKLPDDKRMEIAALYLDHCSGCHQAQGRGIPAVFPPLAAHGVVLAGNPTNIVKVVLGGVPAQCKYTPMPSFASQLTGKGIADLANYIRTSWGNTAPPNATPAMVAKLRRAK
jgi:mono/diheme cytochrome c family protein